MRSTTLAAVVAVLVWVTPNRAHANAQLLALGGAAVGCGLWAVITGLGTGVSLKIHGQVDRRWAFQSTVAWGLLHLAALSGSIYFLAHVDPASVKGWAGALGATSVTGGMLTLSLYGLTVPTGDDGPLHIVPSVGPSYAGAMFSGRF